MQRNLRILFILALLSCIGGYLMSKGSFIGKVGMSIFYREYTFLNVWWQGALALFALFLLLFIMHAALQRTLSLSAARISHIVAMVLAIGGLYFTYHDFRHDFSHRLMGERFHLGFYVFWLGWIILAFSFLLRKRKPIEINRTDEVSQ